MEIASSSEKSVPINQTTRRYIPEDRHNYVLNWINHNKKFKNQMWNAFEGGVCFERKHILERPYSLLSHKETVSNWMYFRSTIFWVVTPCSSVEVHRRLGGSHRLRFQGRRVNQARLDRCLVCSSALKMQAIQTSEKSVNFTELHDATSQKTALFTSTAVRTSGPVLNKQS
jgi:hypothetical protein